MGNRKETQLGGVSEVSPNAEGGAGLSGERRAENGILTPNSEAHGLTELAPGARPPSPRT